ncbi:MAG: 50S ribosomal protein L20 [Actinobacteria bacterium]|nr:50S ribosomal protein L20 [Actinomycetota bacterium]|tara:strand:+ start:126 stop:470 length:345 start_codon:yes stop_codon:yes gene_type:complete
MRTKRGNVARKRRNKILKLAKGFRGGLSKLYRPAHQAVLHALTYKYRDRRNRKRDFRRLWIARINGALFNESLSYSQFMGKLSANNCELNRKMLSEIAIKSPATFKELIKQVNK